MKVLLYTEGLEYISKSGVGRAIKHQMEALKLAGVEYTLDVNDDYDIVHINTYGMKSYLLAKEAKKKGKKVVYHAHSTEEDFRNSFVFSNQLSGMFKKWLIKCYRLGDCLVTPTPYSKRLLEGYNINR
ncbi:MAG: glycosyltransferase, partial [Bacilli bacterium]|nr:glycosyltransferase [Bacilli bacterium]